MLARPRLRRSFRAVTAFGWKLDGKRALRFLLPFQLRGWGAGDGGLGMELGFFDGFTEAPRRYAAKVSLFGELT